MSQLEKTVRMGQTTVYLSRVCPHQSRNTYLIDVHLEASKSVIQPIAVPKRKNEAVQSLGVYILQESCLEGTLRAENAA